MGRDKFAEVVIAMTPDLLRHQKSLDVRDMKPTSSPPSQLIPGQPLSALGGKIVFQFTVPRHRSTALAHEVDLP